MSLPDRREVVLFEIRTGSAARDLRKVFQDSRITEAYRRPGSEALGVDGDGTWLGARADGEWVPLPAGNGWDIEEDVLQGAVSEFLRDTFHTY